jgi:hypothetical protein
MRSQMEQQILREYEGELKKMSAATNKSMAELDHRRSHDDE